MRAVRRVWRKLGWRFAPDGSSAWAKHTATTPTPTQLNEFEIRVYCGFRDDAGVSRIGYVDLEAKPPYRVIRWSREPVLDVGKPGMFDDNGVILGDVVHGDNCLEMFYIGFQKVAGVKFLAFTGKASSDRSGERFQRISECPLLDRTDDAPFIRAVHSVVSNKRRHKVWYAAGAGWEQIDGQPYPRYGIWSTECSDGVSFAGDRPCVLPCGGEYRIGRPRVYLTDTGWEMFYTRGYRDGRYLAGYAISSDGEEWVRMDSDLGIAPSDTGWDSESLCYPALVRTAKATLMVYNGNGMGRTGFGLAERCDDVG